MTRYSVFTLDKPQRLVCEAYEDGKKIVVPVKNREMRDSIYGAIWMMSRDLGIESMDSMEWRITIRREM